MVISPALFLTYQYYGNDWEGIPKRASRILYPSGERALRDKVYPKGHPAFYTLWVNALCAIRYKMIYNAVYDLFQTIFIWLLIGEIISNYDKKGQSRFCPALSLTT